MDCFSVLPLGILGNNPFLIALFLLIWRVMYKGMATIGSTIAQVPYPHLQLLS
jgi:hypothetical protein